MITLKLWVPEKRPSRGAKVMTSLFTKPIPGHLPPSQWKVATVRTKSLGQYPVILSKENQVMMI